MKAENEEMRAEFEKWADSVDIDIRRRYDGSDFYIQGSTWKAWLSWQAAWSASRKSLPVEALKEGATSIRLLRYSVINHGRWDEMNGLACAIESLLPAEKESDNG